MIEGQFCFICDSYYKDFPDRHLMRNKGGAGAERHRRPCFFAFPDRAVKGIYWLVPVSSKSGKYVALYDKKTKKYGKCNTIRFGKVLGTDAAFLIQNMCPVTADYIEGVYTDKNNVPVQIDGRTVQDVTSNAREVLGLHMRGIPVIFPDVKAIYDSLRKRIGSQDG